LLAVLSEAVGLAAWCFIILWQDKL
jgi:hypothetical protein